MKPSYMAYLTFDILTRKKISLESLLWHFYYFNLKPVNSFRIALLQVTSVLGCNFSILFQLDCKKAQNGLFSRIADSFVSLFFSVSPDFKDRFFQV